jgi:hypothetical protein
MTRSQKPTYVSRFVLNRFLWKCHVRVARLIGDIHSDLLHIPVALDHILIPTSSHGCPRCCPRGCLRSTLPISPESPLSFQAGVLTGDQTRLLFDYAKEHKVRIHFYRNGVFECHQATMFLSSPSRYVIYHASPISSFNGCSIAGHRKSGSFSTANINNIISQERHLFFKC